MSRDGFINEFYAHGWSEITLSISSETEQRVQETLSLIPKDCSSILDVGCGDGRITNRLTSPHRKVVGLDCSPEALRHVKTEKILGSVDFLPLPDRSFDLILCCEVLEHLSFKACPKTIDEMQRVAARYIIVTVPNNEDLRTSSVTCPHCGCVFNVSRHVRSFTPETLKGLFSQFSLQTLQFCIPGKIYPVFLMKAAKLIKLVPDTPFPAIALCPQCGYSLLSAGEASPRIEATNRDGLLVRLICSLARCLAPRRKRWAWLIALYRRE